MTADFDDVASSLRQWASEVHPPPRRHVQAAVELIVRYGLDLPGTPWLVRAYQTPDGGWWLGYCVHFEELTRAGEVTQGGDGAVMRVAGQLGAGVGILGIPGGLDDDQRAFVAAAIHRANEPEWPPDRTSRPAIPQVVFDRERERRRLIAAEIIALDD